MVDTYYDATGDLSKTVAACQEGIELQLTADVGATCRSNAARSRATPVAASTAQANNDAPPPPQQPTPLGLGNFANATTGVRAGGEGGAVGYDGVSVTDELEWQRNHRGEQEQELLREKWQREQVRKQEQEQLREREQKQLREEEQEQREEQRRNGNAAAMKQLLRVMHEAQAATRAASDALAAGEVDAGKVIEAPRGASREYHEATRMMLITRKREAVQLLGDSENANRISKRAANDTTSDNTAACGEAMRAQQAVRAAADGLRERVTADMLNLNRITVGEAEAAAAAKAVREKTALADAKAAEMAKQAAEERMLREKLQQQQRAEERRILREQLQQQQRAEEEERRVLREKQRAEQKVAEQRKAQEEAEAKVIAEAKDREERYFTAVFLFMIGRGQRYNYRLPTPV